MNTTPRLWTKDYIVFCLTSLLMLFAFYSLVSTLPLYLDEYLHATKGQIGLILSFYAVGALLLRPFCGYALEVWGRKGVFLSGFFIFCLLFGLYQIPSMKLFAGLAGSGASASAHHCLGGSLPARTLLGDREQRQPDHLGRSGSGQPTRRRDRLLRAFGQHFPGDGAGDGLVAD
jgi:MFS family permease